MMECVPLPFLLSFPSRPLNPSCTSPIPQLRTTTPHRLPYFVFWEQFHPDHVNDDLWMISCGRDHIAMSFENAKFAAEARQDNAQPGFVFYFGTEEDFFADMPELVPL